MSEGLAEHKAARGGYMSTEHPVIDWSSEIGIANFQIGSVFINKPQIWVLNNYILTWKTLKTTFHAWNVCMYVWHNNSNILKIMLVFGQWRFTSPQERNAYWETAIVCVKI